MLSWRRKQIAERLRLALDANQHDRDTWVGTRDVVDDLVVVEVL